MTGLELKRPSPGGYYGTSVDNLLGKESVEDATTAALFRAAKGLTADDKEQVLRFAEFLRSRPGRAPTVEPPATKPVRVGRARCRPDAVIGDAPLAAQRCMPGCD